MEAYYSDTCGAVIVHTRPFIAGLVKRSMCVGTILKIIFDDNIIIGWLLYTSDPSRHTECTWKQPAQSIEVLINRDGVSPVYAWLSIQQRWSQSSLCLLIYSKDSPHIIEFLVFSVMDVISAIIKGSSCKSHKALATTNS